KPQRRSVSIFRLKPTNVDITSSQIRKTFFLAGSLRGFYSRRTKLTTVAQSCSYPVNGQMDCLHHALVGIARSVTSQQFDLYMVERIEVGKAVLNRARQQGILVEQCLLAGDGEQRFNRVLPFGTQSRKDSFTQLGVFDEFRIA